MKILPKSWTHRKEWIKHENSSFKCVCGHPKNVHYPYNFGCSVSGCHCQSPSYLYRWVKR